MKLSTRLNGLQESITLKLNSLAQDYQKAGKTIYNLTAGQLPVKPPQIFVETLRNEALFLRSFQYGPVAGFPELREKFLAHLSNTRKVDFHKAGFDCLVSNGAKHSFANVMAALLNGGDEVITISPYWISYPQVIQYYGGKLIDVKTSFHSGFIPNVSEIEHKINEKTKMIVLNSPNNPTGVLYSDSWMKEFATMIKKYPDVWIVSDEIYHDIVYFDPAPTYFYQHDESLLKQTIILEGISKNLASTGLRIGFCAGPRELLRQMELLQGQLTSGPSSLVQRALIEYDFKEYQDYLNSINDHLRKNADALKVKLKEYDMASAWYQTTSAFYFMLDLTNAPRYKKLDLNTQDITEEFCQKILDEEGVVVVPGNDFGLRNVVRLSIVTSKENLETALDKVLKYLKG